MGTLIDISMGVKSFLYKRVGYDAFLMDYNYMTISMAEFEDPFKVNQEKKSRLRLCSDISIRIFFSNVRALRRAINSHFYSHEVLFLNVFPSSLPLQG